MKQNNNDMNWKSIKNFDCNTSPKFYAEKEIRENFNTNKGYWKQSIVCKIAVFGYYDMKSAWKIFNRIFDDFIDSFLTREQFNEAYNLREYFDRVLTPASDYYKPHVYNGD